jgi:hypothetical protein
MSRYHSLGINMKLFTQKDAWSGGYYELSIELPDTSNKTVEKALTVLWGIPCLDGCYLDSEIEPENQSRLPTSEYIKSKNLFGIANFPNSKFSCCQSSWMIYEDDNECWIYLNLPLSSLGNVYPVGAYPFLENGVSPEIWLKEINGWLESIARSFYNKQKFKVAFIGWEKDDFKIKESIQNGIPGERWDGILLPVENKLIWYPPTIYDAQMT